ncbi:MAG: DNA-3-methyladenine glycosylase 2 family protein [Candidatus Levybacteria bacterium]|nr:DNA-3-methyladenine glycosylase 2 family protein [Candidatus Levybacteria bacterium]
MDKELRFLSKNDPILGQIIKKVPPIEKHKATNYFEALLESIVSQQLSVKAADTIWSRFLALLPGKRVIPEEVWKIDDQKIRDAGISWQKVSYIKDLAKKTMESGILFEQFEIMTDEEIITELVKVKGIGRWTAEMFLMFAMDRPDVFSYGDLGLRRAIEKAYKLRHEPTQEEAEKIAQKWKPYRTIACRYLWRSLELS